MRAPEARGFPDHPLVGRLAHRGAVVMLVKLGPRESNHLLKLVSLPRSKRPKTLKVTLKVIRSKVPAPWIATLTGLTPVSIWESKRKRYSACSALTLAIRTRTPQR